MRREKLMLEHLEAIVDQILDIFDVDETPVPVELMLRRPREGLWPEVDIAELSASFLDLSDRYSPRMSVVRLLARHIARCPWGKERDLGSILENRELVGQFARAIIMPKRMINRAVQEKHSASTISTLFEVPEADVEKRLLELGLKT